MNWNERQELKQRIRTKLANRMIRNGDILRDETHQTSMTCARQIEVIWRGRAFTIIEVDGLICRIERTVFRIKVDYVNGTYMAVKDYGDDSGYLEEIGAGNTRKEAISDFLAQI